MSLEFKYQFNAIPYRTALSSSVHDNLAVRLKYGENRKVISSRAAEMSMKLVGTSSCGGHNLPP